MMVGYARTSTVEQLAGFAAQQKELTEFGCERLFSEQVSSVAERERLAECLRFVREGDVLVVTKPDRLARSTHDLLKIITELESKKVGLVVLAMGGQQIDTRSAIGKMMLTILAAVASFERDVMLERQREGIAKAAAQGKYKGRRPTALAKQDQVLQLEAEGVARAEIAERLRIGLSSVYRIVGAAKAASTAEMEEAA